MRRWLLLLLLVGACTRNNPEALNRQVAAPRPGGHPSITVDMKGASPVDLSGLPPPDLLGRDLAGRDLASSDLAKPHDLASGTDLMRSDMPASVTDGVRCGSGSCPIGQSCCTPDDGQSGFCITDSSQCGTNATIYSCDGPEDCVAGASCCNSILSSGVITCTPNGLCLASTFCHQPDTCAAGNSCCAVSTGSPYKGCSASLCP